MKIKKLLYVILGCIGLALGAVGAVLPLLPAFPFLLLAAFCFAKSSEKLHRWFTGTKLYKNNLESYVKGQGMTWKTKIRIMIISTKLTYHTEHLPYIATSLTEPTKTANVGLQ